MAVVPAGTTVVKQACLLMAVVPAGTTVVKKMPAL